MKQSALPLKEMETFGDLLKFLRRRARISQRELSIALGYSESHLSRLESNQRRPDRSSLLALFVPALGIEDEKEIIQLLLTLAEDVPAEAAPAPTDPERIMSSLDRRTENCSHLPLQITSFVGREADLADLDRLLRDPQTRLVTLTGEGGCGKTRLALRAGEQLAKYFEHGAWLVELAPLSDEASVLDTACAVLGVLARENRPVMTALIAFLRSRHLLLILDNCEHLVEESARFASTLLSACPRLKILSTSRETLGLGGEIAYRVQPLSLPTVQYGASLGSEWVVGSEAVQLFIERGRGIQRSFNLTDQNAAAVARICLRLDGIPLAIELAAARLNVLRPEQIAGRLERSFDLLVSAGRSGGPRHHQTLRTAFDWSYHLLDDTERSLLCYLAIFENDWSLEAAEWIVSHALIPGKDALALLAGLVNKSLVRADLAGENQARYRMLETIRSYLREKLVESQEERQARDCHLDFFVDLSEQADPGIKGPDQIQWLNLLNRERENFRTALSWCVESGNPKKGLQLSSNLGWYWWMIGNNSEGIRWFQIFREAVEAAPVLRSNPYTAKAFSYYGLLLNSMGGLFVKKLLDESLSIYEELGDSAGIGMAMCWQGAFEEDLAKGCVIMNKGLEHCYQAEDSWWIAETLH